MKNPKDQFQIGDIVLYSQEGVITRISGYVWGADIGGLPKIIGYELDCGISVPGNAIKKHVGR